MAVKHKAAKTTRTRRRTAAQKARDAHSTTRPATAQASIAGRVDHTKTPDHIASNRQLVGTERARVNKKAPQADQHDGLIHDPIYWKGKVVEYVRDVGVHDVGYDGQLRQVMIIDTDGKPKVIPESEILREGPVAPPPLQTNRLPKRPL